MSELKVTSVEANLVSGNISSNVFSAGSYGDLEGYYIGNSSSNFSAITSSLVKIGSNVAPFQSSIILGQHLFYNIGTIVSANLFVSGQKISNLAINEVVNAQIFTANGTWVVPDWISSNSLVIVHMWGGGGGGNNTGGSATGGGGGAFVFGYYTGSMFTGNVSVTVGGTAARGVQGQTSIFSATNYVLTAFGGGSGGSSTPGGGGGWLSAGGNASNTGGNPLPGNSTILDSTFGGSGSNTTYSGVSVYGGGSGAGNTTIVGGNSVYGGGGGATLNSGGISVYGGRGGNSSTSATAPGGGGGGGSNPNAVGARGEVRVYTLREVT